MIKQLENTQRAIMKRVCGIPKRSHHSQLLNALDITRVDNLIKKSSSLLYNRIFQTDTPLRDLCTYYLSMFILSGNTIKGTIIDRIVNVGVCPIKCAYDTKSHSQPAGVVESLKQLLYHDTYIKPWSDQHILTVLLTKAF